MSRTLSQIYAQAVYTRNSYLQLTELNSGRTENKMSMMNLLTYVMAVLIHTYETMLDIFEVNIAKSIKSRVNGTPPFYVRMAQLFQYNPVTGTGDEFGFDEETLMLQYNEVNESHRIVAIAAWQPNEDNDGIILKVGKNNDSSEMVESGTLYQPLTDSEMTALKTYMDQVKFIGSKILCISLPGDIITIKCENGAAIYYNDDYITQEQALLNIQNALSEFAKDFSYNGYLYYQSVIDKLQTVENIEDLDSGIIVEVMSYDPVAGDYTEAVSIRGRYLTESGYIRFIDKNGKTTINLDNIVLKPKSSRNG